MTSHKRLDSIDLIQAVNQKIDQVRTRSLDLSFNELADMYRTKELTIDPEYQRLFRWSEGQQSRFIESLILELPVPPIFVIEDSEGKYELIDGLQRISSYLRFRGEPLQSTGEKGKKGPLTLVDCDIVKELNGHTYTTLPRALEIKLKRNFIRVEVLRKESDRRLRYYMFKRLNTGGEVLSGQEIRNCTIRLLDNRFNDFIIRLSKTPSFKACIKNLSDEKKDQKYDQELVLRFFAFKNCRDNYVHDVGEFMTEYMETISDPEKKDISFNYGLEEEVFEKTFKVLNVTLGEHAFSGTNTRGNPVSTFLSYHFEAFTLGIQPYLDRVDLSDKAMIERLTKALREVKLSSEFRKLTTGGGKNYARPLQHRIAFVERMVAPLYEA